MKRTTSLMAAIAFGCVTAFGSATSVVAADQTFVTIGIGGAIARLVNKACC